MQYAKAKICEPNENFITFFSPCCSPEQNIPLSVKRTSQLPFCFHIFKIFHWALRCKPQNAPAQARGNVEKYGLAYGAPTPGGLPPSPFRNCAAVIQRFSKARARPCASSQRGVHSLALAYSGRTTGKNSIRYLPRYALFTSSSARSALPSPERVIRPVSST